MDKTKKSIDNKFPKLMCPFCALEADHKKILPLPPNLLCFLPGTIVRIWRLIIFGYSVHIDSIDNIASKSIKIHGRM